MESIDPALIGTKVTLVAAEHLTTSVDDRNLVGAVGVIRGVHSLDGSGHSVTWFLVEVTLTAPQGIVYVTVPEQCVAAVPSATAPAAHGGYYPPEYHGSPPAHKPPGRKP